MRVNHNSVEITLWKNARKKKRTGALRILLYSVKRLLNSTHQRNVKKMHSVYPLLSTLCTLYSLTVIIIVFSYTTPMYERIRDRLLAKCY